MIAKISKGRSATGGLRYDHGKGRRDEHVNPRKVAGSVAGRTWQERAAVMDKHNKISGAQRPVVRTALRVTPEDKPLTDKQWGSIAGEYVKKMGYDKGPWEATRHGDDHIHITASKITWEGHQVKDSHDYARAQKVCRTLESDHGLIDASTRFNTDRPQVRNGELSSAQRRGVAPERDRLRQRITLAEEKSGGDRGRFEKELAKNGVQARANVASTGKVSGYSYALHGHTDPQGEKVWWKGSQLGKEFSWARQGERMQHRAQRGPDVSAAREHLHTMQQHRRPERDQGRGR